MARPWHVVPLRPGALPTLDLSPRNLPYYAGRSLLRMFIALGASLLFTFVVASWAAKSRRAARVILPTLDILQSVPVLGFLSATVTFFMGLFPGRLLGLELASQPRMHEDERMRSEIRISAQSPTTVCPTPLATAPLELLSPLPLPPIKQDLDVFVPRELLQEMLPKIRLVSRHNHDVSHMTFLSVTRRTSHACTFQPFCSLYFTSTQMNIQGLQPFTQRDSAANSFQAEAAVLISQIA